MEAEANLEHAVMIFSNDYDIECKDRLRNDLERLTPIRNVVLDFTDVTYVDSTALGELIRMHKTRAANGFERETIVVGSPHLQRLFELVQFEKVFRFVPELGDAVPHNGAPTELYYAYCREATA
jgi:anti-anti-sigma factor